MQTERELLLGLLALQNNFISKDQLIAAFSIWTSERERSLESILASNKAISESRRMLLSALVDEHLKQHDNDPEKSLASMGSLPSIKPDLERLADSDLLTSLMHVPSATKQSQNDAVNDPLATQHSTGSQIAASRFRILRPHAAGGLGQVSVALDQELHREVAFKEIKSEFADHPENRQRFIREAEITSALEHPNIVPVYGLGTYGNGRPYYAMRFVKGDSLQEWIGQFHKKKMQMSTAEKRLALRQLLSRFIDVCQAIHYAHSRGILHRDLKPHNVMLGKYGETLVVDWGLAKTLDEKSAQFDPQTTSHVKPILSGESGATLQGSAIGTPAYMSPEQAGGRIDELGPASDIYSLGVTLYHCLTGRVPFDQKRASEVIEAVRKGEYPKPRQIDSDIPKALESICLKAMAVQQGHRYASAAELGLEMERWLDDQPVDAYPEPWLVRAGRWIRSHRTLVATASAIVLMSTIGLGLFSSIVSRNNLRLASLNQSLDTKNLQLMDSVEREREFSGTLEKQRDELERKRLELILHTGYLDCENGRVEIGLSKLANALRLATARKNGEMERRIRRLIAAWSSDHLFSFPVASNDKPHFVPVPTTDDFLSWDTGNEVSPDGKRIAFLDNRNTTTENHVRLLERTDKGAIDLRTALSLTKLRSNAAFSGTGNKVAIVDGNTVKIIQWSDMSIQSVPLPKKLEGSDDDPVILRFLGSGDRLIALGTDEAQQFDPEQALWSPLSQESLQWGAPFAFAISESTPLRIALASESGVHVFEPSRENGVVRKVSKRFAQSLDFSSDGLHLAAAGLHIENQKSQLHNGWYSVWSIGDSIELEKEVDTIGGATLIRYLPDQSSLLVASGDHIFLKSPYQLQTISLTGDAFKRSIIPQSTNASVIATGSQELERGRYESLLISDSVGLRLWETSVETQLRAEKKLRGIATCATFDSTGESIFVGLDSPASGPSIDWRGALDLEPRRTFSSESFGRVNAFAIAKQPNRLYWTGDKTGVCDLDSAETQIFPAGSRSAQRKSIVLVSNDQELGIAELESRSLFTTTTYGIVSFLKTSNGSKAKMSLSIPDKMIQCVAAGPSDELIGGVSDYTVRHWDPKSGKEIGKVEEYPAPIKMVIANDTSPVYGVITENGEMHLKHWKDPEHSSLVLQHTSQIESACISRDGSIAATGCSNGVAQLWDTATGERLGKGVVHSVPVQAVAMSSDARLFFVGAGDMGQVWQIPHAGDENHEELSNRVEWLTGVTIDENDEPMMLTIEDRLQKVSRVGSRLSSRPVSPATHADSKNK